MTRLISAGAVVLTFVASPGLAQLRADLVASGLSSPVAFAQDPSQPDVQLIVEQGGHIRILKGGTLLAGDFLDLSGQVLFAGEQGLLGLALAPDYATSGRLFVNFVNLAGNTVIARFKRSAGNPLSADAASQFNLVWSDGNAFIAQPFTNHKGGNLVFGPDGYLYIGMGDGGSGDDPGHRAQNPLTLLGKMLRIDVSVPDADTHGYRVPADNPFVGQPGVLPEIWDFGVRNPWRFSFDDPSRGGTGALIIGDVGQATWEEIDYEPSGGGGRNYGWRNREGAHDYVTTLPPFFTPLTDPIFEYSHAVGQAITGGFVYRGAALGSAYFGRYFFADFEAGRVWSLGLDVNQVSGEAVAADLREHTAELGTAASLPASFGVDANGELYVLSYGAGNVYRIASAAIACATPDPFTSLGGGTCVNGDWLPPGMAVPGTPPPPPPPPPTVGCATPDPFVSLGGGTCVNGGWLPPGMAVPGTPPPSPPPPPPTVGCATPDPFVSLGGGTCVNGGWLPPGMAIPGTPPPPPPPPPTVGCATPDPFVSLGGGTCVNGGWLPPGMAVPGTPPPPPPPPTTGCATPDPFIGLPGLIGDCVNGDWIPVPGISTTGTVHFYALEGGFWAIQADDGTIYDPIAGLASAFQTEGLPVSFTGKLRPDVMSVHMVGPIIELVQIAVR